MSTVATINKLVFLFCFYNVRESVLNLKLVLLDDATRLQVLTDLVKDSQHGNVGLASTRWSADEKVFIGVIGRLKYHGLDPVQTLHALEH